MQRVKIADEVGIDSIILDHKATFRLAPISHLKPLIAKIRGNSGFSGELGHLALVSIKGRDQDLMMSAIGKVKQQLKSCSHFLTLLALKRKTSTTTKL